MKSNIVTLYTADWKLQDSYGRLAHELAGGLESLGLHVNRLGSNAPNDKPLRITTGGIGFGYPTGTDAYGSLFEAGPRVWVTMFESNQLPYAWADILNEAESVVLPSKWLLDVFKNEGVDTPLHCAPLGISSAFQYVERDPNKPFTFLVIADHTRRKGFEYAAYAFMRSFGSDMNVKLIVKAREGFPMRFSNENVETISADLTDAEMASLYGRADCMIFPGREGFGLPPREFAATGGTAIALNWGGTADHLEHWGLPIAVKGMEKAWLNHPRLDGICGEWAVPDIDDIAATMKHVVAHRAYYQLRGKQASVFVRETYSWSKFAKQVATIWEEACQSYDRRRTLHLAV